MQGIRTVNRWTIRVFLLTVFLGILGCATPKYVATLGASVYHTPDCKYAQQSLDKYGRIKRLDYHLDIQKDLSGRTPCPKCNP